MSVDSDPGLWKQVSGWLWAVLVPIGAWAWKKQDKLLEDRRLDVIDLHKKIDTRAEKLDDKIDQLSRDMNAGLSDLKDILLERRR